MNQFYQLIFFITLFLNASHAADCPSYNPIWKKCHNDSECIIVQDSCENNVTINTKYKPQAQTYYTCLQAVARCPETNQKITLKQKLSCKESLCIFQKD